MNPNQKLIILVGMPRSGTSWIGKIFDSHPDTLYRHEPDSLKGLLDVPIVADVSQAAAYRQSIVEFAAKLSGAWLTKASATLPVFSKSYYTSAQLVLHKLTIMVTKLMAKMFGELKVPEFVDLRKDPRVVLVWKSIESAGRMGVLVRDLPDCSAVLILRHPCGFVASVLRGESGHRFSGDTASHEDYAVYIELLKTPQAQAHQLTLEGLKSMHPVERLAWRWVLFNEKAMDDIAQLKNCTYVFYEELCRDPITQTSKLFAFTGLPWHPQTVAFISDSTSTNNGAYYSVFKDPLKSANNWRSELAQEDISRILSVTKNTRPGKMIAE